VIILDGTMSTLEPGWETNAGLTYKLLLEEGRSARLSLYYEAGVQWRSWRHTMDIITGAGINRQIRRTYGFLASRYRPGDRIFLFGYSRGAYAVRSLAGLIDQVGLLRSEHATERNINLAYRYYQIAPDRPGARTFAKRFCDPEVEIEMVGVWDTVKALGLRLPLLWRLTEPKHAFHNHHLGNRIRHGFHALALDETREAYAPVLWTSPPGWTGKIEQMWFRGNHGDIGGQLYRYGPARPLSNIPLVWMLERAAACGLPLPADWRSRFATDAHAPSSGPWRGWGKLFVLRKRRVVGQDPSESVHPTALGGRTQGFDPPAPPEAT
jgi:uncharacterized protein (DUF2235 family)